MEIKMTTSVLGIDIAKLKFDVALLQNNKYKNKVFTNDIKGFKALAAWLKENKILAFHACLEATGTYGEALSYFLFDNGFSVSVVNPAQIKSFGQSELSRVKTDKADAKLIARYCSAMVPMQWRPLPPHIRTLQAWVKRLENLQALYQEEYNRLEVAQACVQPSIKKIVQILLKEIKGVKSKIQTHIKEHPDLSAQKKLLETIPGVGKATIAQILSFMGTPERFANAKKLVAFVGLNPRNRESGSSVKGHCRLSKTGDTALRKALYMPAIVAKKYNPIIKAFCERLKKAGKANMVIIGAAMRKLLHLIFGVLKSGKPFDPNFALTFKQCCTSAAVSREELKK
jgi:transposase